MTFSMFHKIGKNISHMNHMKSDTNAQIRKLGTVRKPGVVWCSVRGGVVLEMVWCRYRLVWVRSCHVLSFTLGVALGVTLTLVVTLT